MSSRPKIAVIIPAYNRATTIERAVKSVLLQTFKPHEIIIVDDASTDGTAEIIKRLQKENPNIIKYVKNIKNSGAQNARNQGVKNANSEWISFLDSDDEYMPAKLEKQASKVENNSTIDVVSCFTRVVNQDNTYMYSFAWKTYGNIVVDLLKKDVYIDYNAALIRKAKIVEIGYLDEQCPSYQEWDTHIRLSQICHYDCVEEEMTIYHTSMQLERISNSKEREIKGLSYILKKHKKLWIDKLGKDAFNRAILEILKSCSLISDKRTAKRFKFALLKLSPMFVIRHLSITKRLFGT